MLIPVTPNLWVDPRTISSVEHVVVDRHGKVVDYVEIHAERQFWTLTGIDLSGLVARINASEPE